MSKINKGLMTSNTDLWSTPQKVFDELNAFYGAFEIDVCADASNAKCKVYFDKYADGLKQKWVGKCWMNPPYGREIGKWMKKAYESSLEGATVVCLVPARTDTKWWHDYAMLGHIVFYRGRLKFGDAKNSAPFPSAYVVFKAKSTHEQDEALERMAENARELGLDYEPTPVQPVATLWQHGETGRTRITMPGDITDCDARWFKASDLYTSPPEPNQFKPDYNTEAVLVEEMQRMAKRIEDLEALVRADERNRTWTQEHWTEYERSIAAAERKRLHDKFMEIHKSQQHSNNYWHFAARKIMEE